MKGKGKASGRCDRRLFASRLIRLNLRFTEILVNGNMEQVRPAADLTVFYVFLLDPAAHIYEHVIELKAVDARVARLDFHIGAVSLHCTKR
jgi:hypothetical protein